MEAEVSEDGSTGQEGAAHAGEKVPVRQIGWAVRLRHMIGLLDHLTINLIEDKGIYYRDTHLLHTVGNLWEHPNHHFE